jgi:uncharacterized membrane protein YeaQ/YmgE (transglycosylase-associated protein family)
VTGIVVHPDSQGGFSLGIISWIVFGLMAGILAKIIMPGKDPGGMIITILIGISGAMVGGLISTYFGYGDVTGFNWPSFGIAVGGAFLLLFTYRIIKG